MYFTDIEFAVIVFFAVLLGIITIISAYGWLTEYSKRKELEQEKKDLFEQEMALLNSTDIKSDDYNRYIKEIEKSIQKERCDNGVFMS